MTTLKLIESEIETIMYELKKEKEPLRIEKLGSILEQLNHRHERLVKELVAEDGHPNRTS